MVYAELLERCQLGGFRYSALGLRDGILAQMAADYDRSTRSGRAVESERWESIKRAVERYRVDLHHALHVRESALLLFRALKSVHHLPPEYRGMALGRGDALRSRRLREPQRAPSAHLLHHRELRNPGIHSAAAPHYRSHRPLSGKIATHARGWPHECAEPGRPAERHQGGRIAARGAGFESGENRRRSPTPRFRRAAEASW